jgi:disulfide bond formation protein DsbB
MRVRSISHAPAAGLAAGFALAGLGAALISQHLMGMEPCPWCIVQRIAYLLVAFFALLTLPIQQKRAIARALLVLALLSAIGGLAAALYQQFVAAPAGACAFSAPQRFLLWTGLDYALPGFFQASAPCDEANAPLLGVPYAWWSVALATILIGLLIRALIQTGVRR